MTAAISAIFASSDIDAATSALRLGLSLVAGGLIGVERESRRQPAGLRTHILISVGATLLMLLSIYIPQEFFGMKNGDPGRIAAQVVSGIGFLGAGAILKLGNNIRGLTTAASIWVAAAVGLTIGAGLYLPSLIALVIILVTLVLLDAVERRFFPAQRVKGIYLYFASSAVDTKKIQKVLMANKIRIQSVDVVQEILKERVRVHVLAVIPAAINIPQFYKELRALPSVYKIKMDEQV
jgi:putative Mg2+ transporter-C (MgtC) family protein